MTTLEDWTAGWRKHYGDPNKVGNKKIELRSMTSDEISEVIQDLSPSALVDACRKAGVDVYLHNYSPAEGAKANSKQVDGDHYRTKGIQPWDYIAANDLGFFEGSAIKYLTRWKDKGGIADLRKAIHFIEKLIEVQCDPR